MNRRPLFNVLAAISLALFVTAAGLWVRSYFRLDDISHTGRWHVHNFSSVRGRVAIQWGWSTEDELGRATGRYSSGGFVWDSTSSEATLIVESMSRGWRWGGFSCFSWHSNRTNAAGQPIAGEHDFIIPWWFVTALAAVVPTWWLTDFRRHARRAKRGHCLTCGYDLRATPDRCPECGTVVETAS